MDVNGCGIVVTGAGHGTGLALADRMAAEGARIVVNDLDAEAAQEAARESGAAVPGDAASEDGVASLVSSARDHLGRIDVYFANAGIDVVHGLDAPQEDRAPRRRRHPAR